MSDKIEAIIESSIGWILLAAFIAGIIFVFHHADKVGPSTTPTKQTSQTYFANCDEARAAGRENIPSDDPAYRPELDRDGDGLACEPYTP